MSLSHWAVACRGIPKETPDLQKSRPGAGCIGNPRTIGRSGCTPAEPYPPNRKTKISHGNKMRNAGNCKNCNPCAREKVLPMYRNFHIDSPPPQTFFVFQRRGALHSNVPLANSRLLCGLTHPGAAPLKNKRTTKDHPAINMAPLTGFIRSRRRFHFGTRRGSSSWLYCDA